MGSSQSREEKAPEPPTPESDADSDADADAEDAGAEDAGGGAEGGSGGVGAGAVVDLPVFMRREYAAQFRAGARRAARAAAEIRRNEAQPISDLLGDSPRMPLLIYRLTRHAERPASAARAWAELLGFARHIASGDARGNAQQQPTQLWWATRAAVVQAGDAGARGRDIYDACAGALASMPAVVTDPVGALAATRMRIGCRGLNALAFRERLFGMTEATELDLRADARAGAEPADIRRQLAAALGSVSAATVTTHWERWGVLARGAESLQQLLQLSVDVLPNDSADERLEMALAAVPSRLMSRHGGVAVISGVSGVVRAVAQFITANAGAAHSPVARGVAAVLVDAAAAAWIGNDYVEPCRPLFVDDLEFDLVREAAGATDTTARVVEATGADPAVDEIPDGEVSPEFADADEEVRFRAFVCCAMHWSSRVPGASFAEVRRVHRLLGRPRCARAADLLRPAALGRPLCELARIAELVGAVDALADAPIVAPEPFALYAFNERARFRPVGGPDKREVPGRWVRDTAGEKESRAAAERQAAELRALARGHRSAAP